jgi:hypothetical protein
MNGTPTVPLLYYLKLKSVNQKILGGRNLKVF